MDTTADEALTLVRAGIDALLSCDLELLEPTKLSTVVSGLEMQRRRLESVDHQLIAAVEEQRLAGHFGRGSTADLLTTLLRISPRAAKARVDHAADMGPRRTLTGERLEPIFPVVAQAQRDGQISAAHATTVTSAVYRIPSQIAAEAAPVAEQLLVDAARRCEPTQVADTARALLARLDQDGVEPSERDIARRRGLTMGRNADGPTSLDADLTRMCSAVWRTILDALSAPQPTPGGERDDRTPAQRRHDAFEEAGRLVMRSGLLPQTGGAPVTLLVTMQASQLAEQTGYARTADGTLVSVTDLLRAANEAEIIPAVLDDAGGVLAFGRSIRTATCGQRRALAARDGGCSFPGCTRPPAWCQAHHVRTWLDGGPTDLDNLCLVCTYHHREFERRGWAVEMTDAVPHWVPPPWIDPERKPVRNTAHHLHRIDFGDLRALGVA